MLSGWFFKVRKASSILRSHFAARALFRHGVAAAMEHAPAFRQVGALRTVIDVGANRGQFALALRAHCPEAKVYCFEPLANAASKLREVFRNDQLMSIFEVAIGPRSEIGTIHVSGRDDSSSLLAIGPAQDALFPGTAEVDVKQVRVCRLSECIGSQDIARPAMLKLDVQGFELEALRGSDDLLHCVDSVLVECSFVELYVGQSLAGPVIEWMAAQGFTLAGVFNLATNADRLPIQADFLFGRKATAPKLAS